MTRLPTGLDADTVFAALARLAAAPKVDRRRRRLTLKQQAAMAKGRERAARLRRIDGTAAGWKRAAEYRRRMNRRRRYGDRMVDRLLLAMVPGCWHARHDVCHAAGLSIEADGKFLQKLLPAGLVERAVDPEPVRNGGRMVRRYLYRLTRRGELERQAVALLQ